jgi:hypothetical protein
MYWKIRYWWACVSGAIRRALGLAFRNGRTLSEVMYELECDPEMRVLLRDARKAIKAEDKEHRN